MHIFLESISKFKKLLKTVSEQNLSRPIDKE